MTQEREEQRAYFEKVSPMLPELYQTAYAICADPELAEYCLQFALTQHYTEGSRRGMSFRDGLRSEVRTAALEEALAAPERLEGEWNGLASPGGDEVRAFLACQEADARRAAALICGCGCSVSQAARVMKIPQNRLRSTFSHLLRDLQSELGLEDVRSARRALEASVRRSFREKTASMPSVSATYQSFMQELEQEKPSRHIVSRIVRGVIGTVMVLFCIFMIWLAAVLIQPDPLETGDAGPGVVENAQP